MFWWQYPWRRCFILCYLSEGRTLCYDLENLQQNKFMPAVQRGAPLPHWPTLRTFVCFGDVLLPDKCSIKSLSLCLGGLECSFGRWVLWSWEGALGWDLVCYGTCGRVDGQRSACRLCAQQICCRTPLQLALGWWLLLWVWPQSWQDRWKYIWLRSSHHLRGWSPLPLSGALEQLHVTLWVDWSQV